MPDLKKYSPARQDFVRRLVLIKEEAGRLGLWRTMHKIDAATKEVGWEIADIQVGKQADMERSDA